MHIPSLFNKTRYSFLNSSLSVEEIVEHAFKCGHKHVVISDFENSHAWFKFFSCAKKRGLIPVVGLHLNYRNSSILLLSKNQEGYKQLLKLTNSNDISSIDNFENLVFIHLSGEDYFENQEKYVANSDQPNGVYIRENKFLKSEDFNFYCLLRAIYNNTTLNEEIELNDHYKDDYLEKEIDPEMLESQQITNLYSILDECVAYDPLISNETLHFHEDPETMLKNLLRASFEKFQLSQENKSKYIHRIKDELAVIVERGFCEYFLIVWDAINWSKTNGIYIGPGRGSVCGSLVAYILGITEIDPIKYELYFERFLNPTRLTIPDIDIDVESDRREDLFVYLRDKYGTDHVALIAVYQTFRAKNSIREVCRAHRVPIGLMESCLKSVHQDDEINFEHDSFKNLIQNYPLVESHLKKIQNFPKNLSTHAAGVIISSVPISKTIPTISNFGVLLTTQWISEEVKNLGFVKFDFLSLQYLSVLNRMEKILDNRGIHLNWSQINLDDPKVFDTLIQGKNAFIFQFEHEKVKRLIQSFKPSSLLDLSLLSSINRPGASDQIPILLARKSIQRAKDKNENFNFSEISEQREIHNYFQDTFGLLIYQEQLMKLVRDVTNCSVGEADSFRRQLGEKGKEKISQQWFFKEALDRFSTSDLQDLWDVISKFAKYSFNKSHAVAYAVISYRLLWIKTYYPDVFYTELLSISTNNSYFFEIEESGFLVSGPKYGKSQYDNFYFSNSVFYFPINSISGISKFLSKELYERVNMKYTSTLEAIQEFVAVGISIEAIQLLIRSGFLSDLFSEGESEFFWDSNLQNIYDNAVYTRSGDAIFDLHLSKLEPSEEDKKRYLNYQKELFNVDLNRPRINNKLFQKYKTLTKLSSIVTQTINPSEYVGFLLEAKESKTFRDSDFVWLTLCDGFFVSPRIAFFGIDPSYEELKEASENNRPVVLTVEKTDYYKVSKIRIVK